MTPDVFSLLGPVVLGSGVIVLVRPGGVSDMLFEMTAGVDEFDRSLSSYMSNDLS